MRCQVSAAARRHGATHGVQTPRKRPLSPFAANIRNYTLQENSGESELDKFLGFLNDARAPTEG